MPFRIIYGDITQQDVDAVVNAANMSLRMGSGVSGAIFRAAGVRELKSACDSIASIKTGEAVLTKGFRLPAKYIIHAAGPIYNDGNHGEEELLYAAYENSLRCALENGCTSIAFPLISSGSYGYPKAKALHVAKRAIDDFIQKHDIKVYLVLYRNKFLTKLLSNRIFKKQQAYQADTE